MKQWVQFALDYPWHRISKGAKTICGLTLNHNRSVYKAVETLPRSKTGEVVCDKCLLVSHRIIVRYKEKKSSQARKNLADMFQKKFGRGPTAEEIAAYIFLLFGDFRGTGELPDRLK